MGGFTINGFGAKEYFTKVKYLGDKMCPNCNNTTPFYLEKAKYKVAMLYIPTVTIKERYVIMCERCGRGNYIEDAEAQKLISRTNTTASASTSNSTSGSAIGSTNSSAVGSTSSSAVGSTSSSAVGSTNTGTANASDKICPKCGSKITGKFCGICGAAYEEKKTVSAPAGKKICPKCGSEVAGKFCSNCGAEYKEPVKEPVKQPDNEPKKKICLKCGSKITGKFCGVCGARYEEKSEEASRVPNVIELPETNKDWECWLCGMKNTAEAEKCSLCGCEKNRKGK